MHLRVSRIALNSTFPSFLAANCIMCYLWLVAQESPAKAAPARKSVLATTPPSIQVGKDPVEEHYRPQKRFTRGRLKSR